jgi:hypothetical protein
VIELERLRFAIGRRRYGVGPVSNPTPYPRRERR